MMAVPERRITAGYRFRWRLEDPSRQLCAEISVLVHRLFRWPAEDQATSPDTRSAMRPLTALAPAALSICVLAATPLPAAATGLPTVPPRVETPALFDDEAGGNANGDDPA